MKLEKGRITNSQFMFLILGFTLGVLLVLAPMQVITGKDTWVCIIAALVVSIVYILIFAKLFKLYPDLTLIEMSEVIFGKIIGKTVSFLYLFSFLMLVSLNIFFFSEFFINVFMRETPQIIFGLLFLIICGYAVRKGIEVIARCSQVLVPIILFSLILITILLIPNMEIDNFLPFFTITLDDFYISSRAILSIQFAELIFFLMITPYVSNSKKVPRNYINGLIISALILLTIQFIVTLVMAPLIKLSQYPVFEIVRLINIGKLLTRFDIIYVSLYLCAVFIRTSLYLYGLTLGTAQLLNMKTYKPLIIPLGIIALCLSVILFDHFNENYEFGVNIYPIFILPLQLLIPLLAVIISVVRGKKNKVETTGKEA